VSPPNWTGDDGVSDFEAKAPLVWKRHEDGSYRSGEYKIEPLTDSNEYVREWGASVGPHTSLNGTRGGWTTYATLTKAKNAANRHAGLPEEPEKRRAKKPDAATLARQAQQPVRDAYAKTIADFSDENLTEHYRALSDDRARAEAYAADCRWRCAIIGDELMLRDAAGGHEALTKARARRDAEAKKAGP
jgi:hypothetical protein